MAIGRMGFWAGVKFSWRLESEDVNLSVAMGYAPVSDNLGFEDERQPRIDVNLDLFKCLCMAYGKCVYHIPCE